MRAGAGRTFVMTSAIGMFVAAAVTLLGGAPAGAELVNRIVATIDGEPVTQFELESFAEQARRRANPGDPAPPTDRRALLDELILEKIMKKQIEAQGLQASEQQIDAYIASIRERNRLNDAQLTEALSQQGLTREQYRTQVRADIERAALINKEIRNKVNVSPEEIARYYNEHIDQYGTPPRAHVRIISRLVPAGARPEEKAEQRAKAEAIRADAAAGKDFAALAKEHSQGPAASDGGDIGEVAHGQMQPEFEQALGGLDAGGVSKVIENAEGFHILKVEKREGEAHQPIAEVSEAIREKLYRENLEDRYDRWLKQDLRARYHVEILL
jgi:peptidyl-prolyl cis-trans isomerase SurA